ncbi:hypothetical protein JIQ42_01309 [Leishmania sp. Namibia]|uniref:hypothetical protein n=1 Tax=Leishmania sp. Namibia TaxID=2802991 RepID=UPI001B545A8B|nr:hypothetical protein JIQ42_01309 [Leishmania sp. Namibia]
MTSNPYIAQHYGSSVEVMSNGHEDETDATMGFRRFQNAPHMTHTVFRPSKNLGAPCTAAASPSALCIHKICQTSAPDAFSAPRLHKGVPIDEFPSHPQIPRCPKSVASLPPLLPADRLSVGSSDGFRERGTDHLREWVKASTNTSTCSTDDADDDHPDAAAGNGKTHRSRELASASPSAPQPSPGIESEQNCASAPEPSGSLVLSKASLVLSDRRPSVSVSPESLNLLHVKSPMTSPTALPAPEAPSKTAVDAALHQLRYALAQAQRVLDKSRIPGDARRLPLPPAMPPERVEPAQHHRQGAVPPAPTTTRSFPNEEGTLDDSLDCLSPLVSTHMALHTFPSVERQVGVVAATSLSSAVAKVADNVSVPDETRFMVLCAVAHPSAIMERRLRRRGPATGVLQGGLGSPAARSPFAMPAVTVTRRTSPHRIAEVQRSPVTVSASALAPPTSAAQQLLCSPSGNSSSDGHPGSRAPTQRSPAEGSVSCLPRDKPPGMPGLAEFLRAGNPNSFSSLSAATRTTSPAVAKASPSTRGPRRRSGSTVAAAPVVQLGHAPPGSLRRGSSGAAQPHADRAITPSSQLPYAHTDGSVTAVDISPRRGSSRARRVDALPSYAQPTLSWLLKGPEASADEFPFSGVTSPQGSPLKDLATASRDGEQSDRAPL